MADAPLVELVRRLHSGRTLADAIRKVRGRRIGLTRKLAKSNVSFVKSQPADLSTLVADSSAIPVQITTCTESESPATANPDQQAGIDIPPAPR
jgi:hypothetical protein